MGRTDLLLRTLGIARHLGSTGRFQRRALAKKIPEGSRLHLGCGHNHLEGWVNIDIDRAVSPDIRLDLRTGLSVTPGTVALIYSEHVLEHLSFEDGILLLRECRIALRPGGILRTAMPDLKALVNRYLDGWRDQAWLQDPAYGYIDSAARMLNHAFYGWNHRYLYDADELRKRLQEAGFAHVEEQPWGRSRHPALRGLETRPDSKLILEAVAP